MTAPLLRPPVFAAAAVICIACGLLVGAGIHMLLTAMVCSPGPYDPHTIFQPVTTCRHVDNFIVIGLIVIGVVAGIVPHLPPVKKEIYRITDGLEEYHNEKEIRSYFERYP